jgi:hypothetical protein
MSRRVDFDAVHRAAMGRLEDVLRHLLPSGRIVRGEYEAGDLSGAAGRSLKVRLNGAKAGLWADFAAGQSGAGPISLATAVWRCPRPEAARRLAAFLGLDAEAR